MLQFGSIDHSRPRHEPVGIRNGGCGREESVALRPQPCFVHDIASTGHDFGRTVRMLVGDCARG